jgi:hypothetical protein
VGLHGIKRFLNPLLKMVATPGLAQISLQYFHLYNRTRTCAIGQQDQRRGRQMFEPQL